MRGVTVHHRKLWDHPSMSVVNEIDILHDTQSSDYNLVVDDDLRDNESFECNLVVDLGFLPMRTASDESMCDEILIDDDDEDEEDEINEDVDNEDNDIEDSQYCKLRLCLLFFNEGMVDVARSHGADEGNEPPYSPPYNLRTGCESFGENYQFFVRLVSNEVDRHAPLHYRSCQEVPGEIKMSILTTLHHYFDPQRYHNTEYWEGIKQGIQSDCANRYKDRKTKLKNILTKLEVMITLKEQRQNHQKA
ncbi:hypothetical protein R6Q57_006154 [Mikania cordata]